MLLLDTDVLVLDDFSAMGDLQGCVAAAVAHRARVPHNYWQEIYPLLELSLPTDQVIVLCQKINAPRALTIATADAKYLTLPYYNGGMVFMPWDCPLPSLWVEYVGRIAKFFKSRPNAINSVLKSDMAGLAAAIERLKQQGARFKTIPDPLHGHWLHLQGGLLSLPQIKLFHNTGSFKLPGKETTATATWQWRGIGPVWLYHDLKRTLTRRVHDQCLLLRKRHCHLLNVMKASLTLAYRQQKLYNKYIASVLL
ncbi:MAG: hypothetical protein KDJ65_16590 [Anaerolineae bacterium]|nr:hypothetical protein [Anaerolineae bacterium]